MRIELSITHHRMFDVCRLFFCFCAVHTLCAKHSTVRSLHTCDVPVARSTVRCASTVHHCTRKINITS